MIAETLRLTLPKAADVGNLQILARRYDLTIYCHVANAYEKMILHRIGYTPVHIPVQLWAYKGGIEVGQYGGSGGVIPVEMTVGTESPINLSLFNLSVDSVANLTFHFEGYTRYEL